MSTNTSRRPRVDLELARTVRAFFSDSYPSDVIERTETEGMAPELWALAEELGFTLVGIPEDLGGSGGTFTELLVVVQAAGASAAPIPVAETALAAWMLAEAGIQVPTGPMAAVVPLPSEALRLRDGRLDGTVSSVPWASGAERLVMLVEDEAAAPHVVMLDAGSVRIQPGTDVAGMPRNDVEVPDQAVESAPWPGTLHAARSRGSLLRSAQMAGAMAAVLALTRAYVTQREQFGRPVGAFQSVQQHVVALAQAATVSSLVIEQASLAVERGAGEFEAAATKLVVGHQAVTAVRAAHQAHGAIGMTREYALQHLTRRLQAWRSDLGDEQALALDIGEAVLHEGSVVRTISDPDGSLEAAWPSN